MKPAETYVNLLQEWFRLHNPNARDIECLNLGFRAAVVPFLCDLYEEEWIHLQPDMVVVNASNNDRDPDAFAAALTRIAELNSERKIKTLFVLEPNSIEHTPEELPMHAVMREIGQQTGVPVFELHEHMKTL
jgi:hypothetical protein